MALHPVGSGRFTAAQMEHLAKASAIAHTLAIVCLVPLVLGAIGMTFHLSRREVMGDKDHFALAGLVAYGFGMVAIFIAASVSGFIVPAIMQRMAADNATNAPEWERIIRAMFQVNQAFSPIYSVAASVAVVLWSVSALRHGGLGRWIAIYGCTMAPLVILLIAVGHLRMDVHGMTAVVAVHAVWFISAGVQLYRDSNRIENAKL